jgi:hypothetical protein
MTENTEVLIPYFLSMGIRTSGNSIAYQLSGTIFLMAKYQKYEAVASSRILSYDAKHEIGRIEA